MKQSIETQSNLIECDNCNYSSINEDNFEVKHNRYGDDFLYCKDCACCSECRELLR